MPHAKKQLDTDDEFEVTLRVPQSAFVLQAPPPATVNQRTCFDHFGIPPKVYIRWSREGLFPTKLVKQLRFAKYEDVLRCVTEGASAERRFRRKVVEPKDKPDPDLYDECVAYVGASRSPRERRERNKEVRAKGMELQYQYGPERARWRRRPGGRPADARTRRGHGRGSLKESSENRRRFNRRKIRCVCPDLLLQRSQRCTREDLNLHGGYPPDPKSGASTSSATRALGRSVATSVRVRHIG